MSELQTPASPSQPDIDVSQYQRVKSARELDLEAALVAARDVIASYKARYEEEIADLKDQIAMLKDRLHEGQVPPQEEKAQHKEKLQQWLRESALEKEHKMREAELLVANRNLEFEVDSLRRLAVSQSVSKPKMAASPAVAAATASAPSPLLVLALGVAIGVAGYAGYSLGRK